MLTNPKLNILIAIESFYDGGAELFAINLANELSKSQNVFFIELYPYSTKEKKQLALLDLKRIKLLQAGKNTLGNYLFKNVGNENFYLNNSNTGITKVYRSFKRAQVRSFIKKYKIDIVSSHSLDSDVYFAALKQELTFKLVSSFHGHYELLAGKRPNYDAMTISALKEVDKVIYTSPDHEQTLDWNKVPLSKREKIFIGVTMPLTREITTYKPGECFSLIMVARGIKEKGWEEAILSVLHLQIKYPGLVKLNLVGEGEWLDFLKLKYTDPAIMFLGYMANVKENILSAHLGLLPTYYSAESSPTSIIEYLCCGKPVIATNVGAIKEMITFENELAGTCINLQEGKINIATVSDAIEDYIINPGLIEKRSAIAIETAERFTMNACLEKYLTIFMNIQQGKNQNISPTM